MAYARAKIAEGGRVVIPADMRKSLGVQVGDELLISLEDNQIRMMTLDEAVRRAQAIVRRYVPENVSLADELIAERRAEAARE